MKRIGVVIFCIVFSAFCCFPLTAQEAIADEVDMQRLILEKNALRNYCIENNVAVSFASMDQEVRKSTKETIYNKVFAGEMDIDNGLNLLEDLGVFPVESTIMSLTTSANVRSSPTAIASNNVAIFYDSVNDTWELGAGVWWDNDAYVNDYPLIIIPRIGDTYVTTD